MRRRSERAARPAARRRGMSPPPLSCSGWTWSRPALRCLRIVAGPAAKPGHRIAAPIYLQDVMPTTLELAGVAKPAQVRVIGSDHSTVLLHGLIPETLVRGRCDGGQIQLRILREEILEPVQ